MNRPCFQLPTSRFTLRTQRPLSTPTSSHLPFALPLSPQPQKSLYTPLPHHTQLLWASPKEGGKEKPKDKRGHGNLGADKQGGAAKTALRLPLPHGNHSNNDRRNRGVLLREPQHVFPIHRDALSLRWETIPPTAAQLKIADCFFLQYPPKFLWSAQKFKTIEFGNAPEVAFLGRSNVGKSSLLNATLHSNSLARTSSKPGHTRLMNAFAINCHKLVLLDMPGYGYASRPEWGIQIMKYLQSRKQLRRAFILIDALHGPKNTDLMLIDHLGASGVPYQIVLSKIDRLQKTAVDATFDEIKTLLTDNNERRGTSALGEVIGTAADPAKKGMQKLGISELRWSIMVAGGLDGSITL